jgi:hypothetical protein
MVGRRCFFRLGPQIPRIAMNQEIREMAVVVICAFIAGFFGLWNALLEMEVLDLVNTKLPPEKQYPLLGWNYRYFELRREYKKMFPSGTLLQKADKVKLIAISIFFGGIILQFLLNRAWL